MGGNPGYCDSSTHLLTHPMPICDQVDSKKLDDDKAAVDKIAADLNSYSETADMADMNKKVKELENDEKNLQVRHAICGTTNERGFDV